MSKRVADYDDDFLDEFDEPEYIEEVNWSRKRKGAVDARRRIEQARERKELRRKLGDHYDEW